MIRIIIALKLAKILLVPPKYETTFGVLSKCLFFQYCDNNVRPFSIAPNSIIAITIEIISNLSKEDEEQ